MTKIDIISGFLGAGKTTLIKKLLAEAYQGEKLVLIENEFGEISIDGGFLKDSGVQVSEMSSGCICCSLVGDFNKALKEVHQQFQPDRILIEPSGVGKLSDVIVAVENTVKDVPDMKLNSFVTVADASKVKVYMKNFGEFYNNQIESAGTIILSRTQKLSQEKLEAAAAMLREKNADAAIITTPWDQIDGKTILAAVEKVSLADEMLEKMRAEHEADEHEHEHEHHHHHHELSADAVKGRAFLFGIVLNTLFVIGEFTAGFLFQSMGLLADAGHNLGDVSGLLISLAAFLLARKRYCQNYTYGFRKSTIWASLLNAAILLIAVGVIMTECIRKFLSPAEVGGWPIIITAGIGVVINGLTAFLFIREKEHDLNVKGAYLHMLADTLVSVGVVLSGVLILWTGWNIVDPLIGLVIAVVILFSTWRLLKESVRLAMDGVPEGIQVDDIREHLLEDPNVKAIHHLHIWPISTTENALTAHVVLNDLEQLDATRARLHEELAEHGISHATLEFESPAAHCPDEQKLEC